MLTGDDWKAWRSLRLEALAESPRWFGSRLADWQGERDREERWRARLELPGAHNLLAVLDGRPAGMVSGVPVPGSDTVALISMWVHPDARGEGVGDRLIAAVERWAARRGARELCLDVAPDNAPAISLYRRHGFRHTGAGDVMPDGVRREKRMTRPL